MLMFEVENPKPDQETYANRQQAQHLANNLKKTFPDVRFQVEKKSVSPVHYIRILDTDIDTMTQYFQQLGLQSLPATDQQLIITGKYQNNILSFEVGDVVYTLVVASSGRSSPDDKGKVDVSIKELTPTALGLAGQRFTKDDLVRAARQAVQTKFANRAELKEVLLALIDVALGSIPALPPELNDRLSPRSRAQIGTDFGEVLAPLKFMDDQDTAEFPAAGNEKLIDVTIGNRGYSVKSLTGSGTSFRSISDLMDRYEASIVDDDEKQQLFRLFKAFHPESGGKNVDKILRGAQFLNTLEYQKLLEIVGKSKIDSYPDLQSAIKDVISADNKTMTYSEFLRHFLPMMTAGGWRTPVGLPQDGPYYLGQRSQPPKAKTAGAPSYKANPVKAAADIVTYSLGVGLLNSVTQGPNNSKYDEMMTDIVTKSPVYLGKIDLDNQGRLVAATKPFSDLKFRFDYHAPSHLPGNNLPGFIIVYD